MEIDHDDSAGIAAAVRILAVDAHRAIAGAARGEVAFPDAVLADLHQWADVLLDQVGEGRLDELRRWLVDLQRRIFVVRWLMRCRAGRPGIRGRGRGLPGPITAAT